MQHPPAHQHQYHSAQGRGNRKALLHRLGDGVGLDHAAAGQAREDTEDAKQHRQQLADGMWDAARTVIHRTAAEGAGTGTAHPPSDRQKDLHIFGHHPEQRADPHPEDAARATQRQRCTHADDVADPHRTAQRGTDSGKGRNAVLGFFFAKQRTERLLCDKTDLPQRKKVCKDGKIKPAQQGEGDGPASPQQLHRPVQKIFEHNTPPHPV